jgi:hypothetical protein
MQRVSKLHSPEFSLVDSAIPVVAEIASVVAPVVSVCVLSVIKCNPVVIGVSVVLTVSMDSSVERVCFVAVVPVVPVDPVVPVVAVVPVGAVVPVVPVLAVVAVVPVDAVVAKPFEIDNCNRKEKYTCCSWMKILVLMCISAYPWFQW